MTLHFVSMASPLVIVPAISVVLFYLFKFYCKLTTGWCKSYLCLVGKTAIVTGANTGIGYYTALDFAKRGARVILACRDESKAREAQKNIIEATNNENVIVKLLDLSSFESVRKFAEDINANEKRIDILVNNAGLAGLKGVTSDGLPVTMQTNYFSHFLLTHLLMKLLKMSAPSRVINVSSIAAKWAKIDLDKITEPTTTTKLYYNSKLAQIFFTKILAKKLEGSGVTVYSLHPGCVGTDIFRTMKYPLKLVMDVFVNWFFKTNEEGAQTTLHVALTKDIEHLNGEHFADCKHVPTYRSAKDDTGIGKKLWEKSEQVVKLQPDEII